MLRTLLLPLLLLASSSSYCVAQETQPLWSPSSIVVSSDNLPTMLLDIADKSKINIVADTTTQDPDPSANRPLGSLNTKTVGQVIGEQAPVYGYYWNQTDASTVLIWPKPDIVSLARKIATRWHDQNWQPENLPSEIKTYFLDVARKVDQDGGHAKRNDLVTYNLQLTKLPEGQQKLLLPLLVRGQRQSAVSRSLTWLSDDFWSHAFISISRFDNRDVPFVSGSNEENKGFGRGLSQPLRGASFVPYDANMLPNEAVDALLGSRWVGTYPLH